MWRWQTKCSTDRSLVDSTNEAEWRSHLAPHQPLILVETDQGLAPVTAALAHYRPAALHLVSHGSPGHLALGNADLSTNTLAAYQPELARWREAALGSAVDC